MTESTLQCLAHHGKLAAAYVRMSTSQQDQSIPRQLENIHRYAATTGCSVMRVYRDEGISGVTAVHRAGLRQLLADIANGAPGFQLLLVDDVSRWGRFQDVDEAAYYDFLCARAGVRVVYCSEQFPQLQTPLAHLWKDIKRVMAAEYSRQLSEKIFAAQAYLAQRGYKQGGAAGFAMRRVCLRADGEVRKLLARGECKGQPTDRVVLAPGASAETEVVRRIFSLYTARHLSRQKIADALNESGTAANDGGFWSVERVRAILRNEKYCGNLTYNLTSSKLGDCKRNNDPSLWIRREQAFDGIVSAERFAEALCEQRMRRGQEREATVEKLRDIHRRHGKLNARLIKSEPGMPHVMLLNSMFGSLQNAYLLALPEESAHNAAWLTRSHLPVLTRELRRRITECIVLAGHCGEQTAIPYVLKIDGGSTLRVTVCTKCRKSSGLGWTVPVLKAGTDFVLAGLLSEEGTAIIQYILIVTSQFVQKDKWLTETQRNVSGLTRSRTLEPLFGLGS